MRERIRAGDPEAFGELYDRYAKAVYNHAFRLTGDWSAAEDVMSATFLDAWRNREGVEGGQGSLRPWLLGIATNKARNARRSALRRWAFLSRLPDPEPVEDFAEETAGRIDDARRLAAVHRATKGLRRQDREVLALCVWSGLGYQEAAQALGVPVGTVRSRLSRARGKLRALADRQLANDFREPPQGCGEVKGEAATAALPEKEVTP
ncbi:RNA polymerase sigma factor [Streptomyces vinaceus]|uniref:RNA polymerase sigma factor n=1 Tax=Streptomyces vinaceus TaxID=1960 RepID=UPI0037F9AD40